MRKNRHWKSVRSEEQQKTETRAQFAALCYRKKKKNIKILLVTSRRTGRWTIPKGWLANGFTPQQSALKEAYEEAGVRGKLPATCIGHFWYRKNMDHGTSIPCIVAVFPVEVDKVLDRFPECKSRKRKWFNRNKAARLVAEPSLLQIIQAFDPFA